MPHFIIECSDNILEQNNAREIMRVIYDQAEASGLFAKNDIKVRLTSYKDYLLADGKSSFLHVFGHIMEGRTESQKALLSKNIIQKLNGLLPELSILSMNISEFHLSTYCNKFIINPANTDGNRHFGL